MKPVPGTTAEVQFVLKILASMLHCWVAGQGTAVLSAPLSSVCISRAQFVAAVPSAPPRKIRSWSGQLTHAQQLFVVVFQTGDDHGKHHCPLWHPGLLDQLPRPSGRHALPGQLWPAPTLHITRAAMQPPRFRQIRVSAILLQWSASCIPFLSSALETSWANLQLGYNLSASPITRLPRPYDL
ncbi:hypothetical protein CSAL01_06763 [Colletotrichum salicis]|uniref:Uncharacterized protein n=1 Tax=Colletotrichum salicis TaxID=1209931 RepID=A0A135U582_9PEZI|nr:hypothetical protein CSAL01_06763 [Colletotrichum salicis]